jgi:hypothetical protein
VPPFAGCNHSVQLKYQRGAHASARSFDLLHAVLMSSAACVALARAIRHLASNAAAYFSRIAQASVEMRVAPLLPFT